MKKYISILILLVLTFGVVGCRMIKKEISNDKDIEIESNKGDDSVTLNSKGLVLYFSATKTTEKIAFKIKEVTNSDIIEIIPKEKYSTEDLDYNNNSSRANKEQNDSSVRPEIENDINISHYERIYLGYPIWWGTCPKIILSLLDNYNFDGKEVVLFATSGSSGIDASVSELRKYNSKMNVLGSMRFSSSASIEEIKSWIDSFN